MGACCIRCFLLFLLGASLWTLVRNLRCEVGTALSLEDDPSQTFNWTSKAEQCLPGELCQETVVLIKADGGKTALLASKGCTPQGTESMTFIQYTPPPPGLVVVSYSNYCNDSLCNSKESVRSFWYQPGAAATARPPGALRCPTCVALGSCTSAPSLPCANGTTQCYQGRLDFSGGGLESTAVEVKGCTTVVGCRLLATLNSVGPLTVKESCGYRPVLQPRQAESGGPWGHASLWALELLLPAVLLALAHFP
ncbi:testis-expressed protein 101 [Psammomys obesus]|uniref:testis-expressed protein 101 n=1 Tax=Psammomys obesus TaxID=48139 RepID=UPI002452CC24|nr:testis-expressed protein 101 [Psammomys obesus]